MNINQYCSDWFRWWEYERRHYFFCRTRSSQSAAMCSAHNTRIGKISTWAKIGKKRKLLKRKMAGLAGPLGPSIKYISFFLLFSTPPPPCHHFFIPIRHYFFLFFYPFPPKKVLTYFMDSPLHEIA